MDSPKAGCSTDFDQRCLDLGVDPQRMRLHRERIREVVQKGASTTIPITDTCRVENGGILRAGWTDSSSTKADGFVSFIPAAGASSRYFKPLQKLRLALSQDSADLPEVIESVRSGLPANTPLPPGLRAIIVDESAPRPNDIKLALEELEYPKAFLPCVVEGNSFVDLKIKEYESLSNFSGQVFVSNPRHQQMFLDHLPESTKVLVQGPEESTLRFDREGEAFRNADQSFSMVPAGHGTLTNLIRQTKSLFPSSHSVLIRNIDNVIGTSTAAQRATQTFLADHFFLLNAVRSIRQFLDTGEPNSALEPARQLLQRTNTSSLSRKDEEFIAGIPASLRPLWEVQCRLFHLSHDLWELLKKPGLAELYARPVNSLGMVPNTEKNIGGSPAFVRFDTGNAKICLEGPHISEKDQDSFLRDPDLATHFNPVFVAAEMNFSDRHYESEDFAFWLIAEKTFAGQTVFYHETILYELLGNNVLANCVFTEIPRTLFNPHKNLSGSAGRSIDQWLG